MNFELAISQELEATFFHKYGEIDYLSKRADFISKFKSEFLVEHQKLNELSPKDLIGVKIHIDFSNEKAIQASISINNIDSNWLNFHVYEHVYVNFLENPKHVSLTTDILHELIHYLDFSILNEINDEYQHQKLKIKPIHQPHSSIEWMFIHLLATIRNEGVALLGEKLFSNNHEILNSEIAFSELENDLNLAISLCHSSSIDRKKININELKNILYSIEKNAYKYADVILFHFLNATHNIETDLISIIKSKDNNLKLEILRHAFSYDLSEWLRALLITEINNSIDFKLNYSKLNALTSFLVLNTDSKNSSIHLNQILLYAHQNDVSNFINLVKHITIEKLNYSDLINHIEKYKKNQSYSDIEADIYLIISNLLDLRSENNHEIIDWSLSYLFNKKDLFHDEISFLGYQDDWLILESTSILLKKNPKLST